MKESDNLSKRFLVTCLIALAIIPVLFLGACAKKPENKFAVSKGKFKVTKLWGPTLVEPKIQFGTLILEANPKVSLMFWEKLAILQTPETGIALVDRQGKQKFKKSLTSLTSPNYGSVIQSIAVLDNGSPVAAFTRIKSRTRHKYHSEIYLVVIDKRKNNRQTVIKNISFEKYGGIVSLIKKSPGKLTLFWDSLDGVKRQDFIFNKTDKSMEPLGKPLIVSKRKRLLTVDKLGNLYFVKQPVKKGVQKIILTKTDMNGNVLFENLLVGKSRVLMKGWPGSAEVYMGDESFMVTWLDKFEDNDSPFLMQQVSASGELLGKLVRLRPNYGGMRTMETKGRAVVRDIAAVGRREHKIISTRIFSWQELDRAQQQKKPIFKFIDEEQNQFLIKGLKDFLKPSRGSKYGSTLNIGVKDRFGDIECDIRRLSKNRLSIKLYYYRPKIIIDLYRAGNVVKSLDLGYGEDISLAGDSNDLLVAWNSGRGFPALKVARWRLFEN